ncbi:hypothetical protein ACFQ2K_50660 [Streptomyces sanglieri]|uniref:Uncharacterized protein n=1 Tax=Streptomyces sanglieri TaxID=193460 RepID=A0ABW2X752_9ACTN
MRLTAITRSVATSKKLTASTPALTGPTHALALRTTATAFDAHRGKAW